MVKDPELRALRRDLRALLSAWRRTLKEDKAQGRRSSGSVAGVYYRGIADAMALCIQQLNSVMFSLSGGAPAHAGAPRFPRRRL